MLTRLRGSVTMKLLVDDFARAGYYTYAPDLFDKNILNDDMKNKEGVSVSHSYDLLAATKSLIIKSAIVPCMIIPNAYCSLRSES